MPYKNIGFIVYLSLTSQASRPQFQTNPTLAAGDATLSVDGAAAGNLGALPTVTPAGGKRVKITVAATENTGTNGSVMFSDQAGAEWDDLHFSWENDRSTLDSGTAQAGAANSVTLQSTASAVDNIYRGAKLAIIGGTGAGQDRIITGYTGSSKVAAIARAWATNPDNTSIYIITPDASPKVDDNLAVVLQPITHTSAVIPTVTALTNAPSDSSGVTTLLGRVTGAVPLASDWTPTRAGYLDVLNGLVTSIWANATRTLTALVDSSGVTTLLGRITQTFLFDGSGNVKSTPQTNVTVATNNDKTGYALAVAPPSASAIADQVWDEAAAGHDTAGSMGALMNDAGTASDPLLNAVPGTYLSGTAGAALGKIGSGQITTVSPVAQSGDVECVIGDDYSALDGRSWDWTDVDAAWPDLAGATINFYSNGFDTAGTVVTPSGAGKAVRVQPTATDTNTLIEGEYAFVVVATLTGGRTITLAAGTLTALRKVR